MYLHNSNSSVAVLHIVLLKNIFICSTAIIVEITNAFHDYSGKVTYLTDMDVTNMACLTLDTSSSLGATTSGKFWPSQGILSIWDGF
jgi:hypothetical protein